MHLNLFFPNLATVGKGPELLINVFFTLEKKNGLVIYKKVNTHDSGTSGHNM